MENRAKFDFEISFTNGGGIQGQDFRLDIPGDDINDEELADYLVRDMRLLMVQQVRILNKSVLAESHKRQLSEIKAQPGILVDLSHTIESGLITYRGLPAPVICDFLSREDSRDIYEAGTEFQIARIDMVANTGTYLDCPFHRYADGLDLSEVDPASLADLPGIVIRADYRETAEVGVDFFRGKDIRDRAVLVHTGWDQFWDTDQYFEGHPFLTAEAAVYLKENGARLVGIDSLNIDDIRGKSRPVHSSLLRENILIVEHLCNLDQIPDDGFTFSAIPPKFKGVGTFPIRALARIT